MRAAGPGHTPRSGWLFAEERLFRPESDARAKSAGDRSGGHEAGTEYPTARPCHRPDERRARRAGEPHADDRRRRTKSRADDERSWTREGRTRSYDHRPGADDRTWAIERRTRADDRSWTIKRRTRSDDHGTRTPYGRRAIERRTRAIERPRHRPDDHRRRPPRPCVRSRTADEGRADADYRQGNADGYAHSRKADDQGLPDAWRGEKQKRQHKRRDAGFSHVILR